MSDQDLNSDLTTVSSATTIEQQKALLDRLMTDTKTRKEAVTKSLDTVKQAITFGQAIVDYYELRVQSENDFNKLLTDLQEQVKLGKFVSK